MEDKARDILGASLSREESKTVNLAAAIRARFKDLGGVSLPEIRREALRAPVDLIDPRNVNPTK
jgi:plasmid stability protein